MVAPVVKERHLASTAVEQIEPDWFADVINKSFWAQGALK